MPQSELVLSDLYRRSFRRYADREAVASRNGRITYRELAHRALAIHDDLKAAGLGPGDPVVLLLRNSIDFIVADVALVMLGACKAPLNDLLAADDVGYMVEHSGAKAIIAHTSFARLIAAVGAPIAVVPVRLSIADDDQALEGFRAVAPETTTPCSEIVWPEASAITSDHNALIIYTGGTTGRPKGVVHTQRSLFLNYLSHQMNLEIREDDYLLVCSPLPHSAQLFAAATLLRGGRVWIERSFDAGRVLRVLQDERTTTTFLVPTMIYRLLDHPGLIEADTTSLRSIVYGASPITSARLKQAVDRFGPVLQQVYGQTEVPNLITTLSKEDHAIDAFRTSCGQPVQFVDIVIRDAEGNPLPRGQVGEVTVRSSYALERYHDDPLRTAEAYLGEFLRTGDIGYLDESDHLFLVDRAKDMIVSGGFNVYSTEVENVMQQCDGVRQVAVIGVPDDQWGEAVTAFVIPDDATFDEAAALKHCREHLARYKVPKTVRIVDEIPLTAYGKPDKKALRAKFWGSASRQVN